MFHVQKNSQARLNGLTQWRHENRGHNFTFEALPGEIKTQLRFVLLEEQGYLCCYTGLRVGFSCSLEHLITQKYAENNNRPDLLTDYNNLMAYYGHKDFGAAKKGRWPENDTELALFLNPIHPRCTEAFTFTDTGDILPRRGNDLAAEETIRQLNLKDELLKKKRRDSMLNLFKGLGRYAEAAGRLNYIDKRIRQLSLRDGNRYEELFFVQIDYLQRHRR